MKKMRWLFSAVVVLAGVALLGNRARAADHTDGPAVTADPSTDITDLYAWVDQTDSSKIDLLLNVFPAAGAGAQFSDTAKYVIHVNSTSAYGTQPSATTDVICTFSNATPQVASCWVGTSDYVTGNASDAANPIVSADGKLTVFAGLRDDPFFFNLDGFKAVSATVHGAVFPDGGLPWPVDNAGCPNIPSATSQAVAGILASNPADGGAAVDHFAGLNVLSIALQIDSSLLTTGGPILGVWASTNQ